MWKFASYDPEGSCISKSGPCTASATKTIARSGMGREWLGTVVTICAPCAQSVSSGKFDSKIRRKVYLVLALPHCPFRSPKQPYLEEWHLNGTAKRLCCGRHAQDLYLSVVTS